MVDCLDSMKSVIFDKKDVLGDISNGDFVEVLVNDCNINTFFGTYLRHTNINGE